MNCRETQARFDDRLDQRLPVAERDAFDQHLAGCAACWPQWEAYAGVWQTVAQHAAPEPSFGFAERALRRRNEPVAAPWWVPVWRWAALALVLAALGVGGVMMRQRVAVRRAALYVDVQQGDYLEDYDVVASLDLLEREDNL